MQYIQTRKMFLFDEANAKLNLIESISEGLLDENYINDINEYFLSISKRFVDSIFTMIYTHVYNLELNIFNNSKAVNIEHVKNIHEGILSNRLTRVILKELSFNVESCIKSFGIKKYFAIMDLVEELDLICIFEMYSYLLGEDIEDVLSFILSMITQNVVYNNHEKIEDVNSRVLSEVERKINLFKKIYDDEEVVILIKNADHIIYKINDVMKLVQLFN